MSLSFNWLLDDLNQPRFQAFTSLLRLRNGGQLEGADGDHEDEYDAFSFMFPHDTEDDDLDSTSPQELKSFDDEELKRRFLDRTAEIFSNIKGGPHVASTLLAEWPGVAEVFVAKNRGLSEEDLAFRDMLQGMVRVIAMNHGEPEPPQFVARNDHK